MEGEKSKDVAGVILAGGKSSRFGEDKRFFKYNGKTFLEISLEKLEIFERKYIVLEPNFHLEISNVITLNDPEYYKGPLFAIFHALNSVQEKACVFIPIDMPFITEDMLKELGEKFPKYDVAYFKGERIYSLPLLCSKSAIPQIKEIMQKGEFSITSFLKAFPEERKCEIKVKPTCENLLKNINRKEDIEKVNR